MPDRPDTAPSPLPEPRASGYLGDVLRDGNTRTLARAADEGIITQEGGERDRS
jgi:hypothetical protein